MKTSAQRNFFWEFQFKIVFTRLSRAPSSVVTCRRRECLFPILLSLLDLFSLYPPKYQFSTPLVLAAGIERDRGESATQPRLPAYPAIASQRCTLQHLPPPLYKFSTMTTTSSAPPAQKTSMPQGSSASSMTSAPLHPCAMCCRDLTGS